MISFLIFFIISTGTQKSLSEGILFVQQIEIIRENNF